MLQGGARVRGACLQLQQWPPQYSVLDETSGTSDLLTLLGGMQPCAE